MRRLDAMTGRKYKDAQGQEKTSWLRIGVLLMKDDGKMSLKLEAYPLPNEKGEIWISFMEPRDRRTAPDPAPAPGRNTRARDDLDDSIPF